MHVRAGRLDPRARQAQRGFEKLSVSNPSELCDSGIALTIESRKASNSSVKPEANH